MGRLTLYRTVLAGRRALIVLDDARDAEQVRPLLPGSPPYVVTSRDSLAGLVSSVGAHCLTLNPPSIGRPPSFWPTTWAGSGWRPRAAGVAQILPRCARAAAGPVRRSRPRGCQSPLPPRGPGRRGARRRP